MGLEGVLEKIEREAQEEIRKIGLGAESESAKIIADAQQAADADAARRRAETDALVQAILSQEASSAELERRKLRLGAQKEILEKAYADCVKSLGSLDHEKTVAMLLGRAKRELPEAVYVYSSSRDEAAVRKATKLAYAGNIDCAGGIIAENGDRTLRLDLRYETIAQGVWSRNLREISKALFGENNKP